MDYQWGKSISGGIKFEACEFSTDGQYILATTVESPSPYYFGFFKASDGALVIHLKYVDEVLAGLCCKACSRKKVKGFFEPAQHIVLSNGRERGAATKTSIPSLVTFTLRKRAGAVELQSNIAGREGRCFYIYSKYAQLFR
jgi:hypothetical protein